MTRTGRHQQCGRPATTTARAAAGSMCAIAVAMFLTPRPSYGLPPNPASRYGISSSVTFDTSNLPNHIASQAKIIPGGYQWVRITFLWDEIEKAEFACIWGTTDCDWSVVDAAVNDAVARGLGVLAVLTHVPAWAHGPVNPNHPCVKNDHWSYPPLDYAYMFFFARAAAARYRDRIAAWEIGNEVNKCQWWKGTPKQFRELYLKPAWDGIKSDNPPIAITGGPGILGESLAYEFNRFLTEVIDGVRVLSRDLDFFSFHVYDHPDTAVQRINNATNWSACNYAWHFGGFGVPYCVNKFWLTEFGYGTTGAGCQSCGWGIPCDKGVALVKVLNHCINNVFCQKAFIWNLYRNTPSCGVCDTPLLNDSLLRTNAYCHVRNYILEPNHPIPTCQNLPNPCVTCPCGQ